MAVEVYDPNVHIEAARIAQLERIFVGSDLFLAGSLARAAVTGAKAPEICTGKTGSVRDIDVIYGQEGEISLSAEAMSPFPVDIALNGLLRIRPSEAQSRVLFDNRRPDVFVELPSEVFEPYAVRVGGQR